MEINQIENTLKKMGLVLEKLVNKVDEIDKRVAKIEEKLEGNEKKFTSADLKNNQAQTTSSSGLGNFGSSFLGSMVGSLAGMGVYNLLFNHSVSPVEMGQTLGMNENEINNILEEDINEIDSKLEEIDSKLEELDEKISQMDEDVINSDYFESYEETGDDFGEFDDFGDFDDI